MRKCLFISGIGKFGSGKVNELILSELGKRFQVHHANTQGMRFKFFELIFKIPTNNIIFFSPSIGGWSVLRDVLIFILLWIFRRKFYVVCLCDLSYSRLTGVEKFLLNMDNIIEVWSPAQLPIRKSVRLFRQYDNLELKVNSLSGEHGVLVYGNYLEKDKGFDDFKSFVAKEGIENYYAFGAKFDNRSSNVDHHCLRTYNSEEFALLFRQYVNSNNVFFFGSHFDLAPLTLTDAVSQNSAIFFGNLDAENIARNYLEVLPNYTIFFENGRIIFNTNEVTEFNQKVLTILNKRDSIRQLVMNAA